MSGFHAWKFWFGRTVPRRGHSTVSTRAATPQADSECPMPVLIDPRRSAPALPVDGVDRDVLAHRQPAPCRTRPESAPRMLGRWRPDSMSSVC
jgi:hypothetical protein